MRGYNLDKKKQQEELILPWVVDGEMKDVPCLKIHVEDKKISLNLLVSKPKGEYELKQLKEIDIIPILFKNEINFAYIKHTKFSIYDRIQITQSTNIGENGCQEIVIACRLSHHVFIMHTYRVDYKRMKATIVAVSYLLSKKPIEEKLRVQPLFTFNDAMHVSGIIFIE